MKDQKNIKLIGKKCKISSNNSDIELKIENKG